MKAAIGGESGADEGRLLADDRRARFTARIQGRPPTSARGVVELAIDPSQLHLFDPDTGQALQLERERWYERHEIRIRRTAAMRPASWRRVWVLAASAALAAIVLLVLLASGEGKSLAPSAAAAYAPPPANAKFDYQIGGDYPPPAGVRVVSRDWFSGSPAAAEPVLDLLRQRVPDSGRRGRASTAPTSTPTGRRTWSSTSSATTRTGAAST